MAKLTDEVKTFIVQRLACFDTPSEIAAAVKAEFALEIPRQQVASYDPSLPKHSVAEKWQALFDATRKAFVEDIDRLPIANKAWRLERLEQMARKAAESKNYVLAADLLEQAAREVGNAYTNRRELTGKDGEPLLEDAVFELKIGRPPAPTPAAGAVA